MRKKEEERERRESLENELLEAYRRHLNANHEQDNVDAEVDATIRDLDEEVENREDDDDFFAGLYDNV